MLMRQSWRLSLLVLTSTLLFNAVAGTVYDESVSGDLSNNGLAPTAVSVALGSNSIFGTTGAGINGIDLDYLTITVLPGLQLSSIVLLPGTVNGGLFSFIGVQAGNQVTVSPSALDATGLLGWWHYNTATDINTDILGEMGIPAMGSTGFTPPLGPGDYSFWIQERGPGVYPYGFDFVLESSVSAPEPGTSPALLGGLLVLASAWRRRGRR